MIFKVGETALHKSCRNAHHAIVKELLGYVKKHNTNLKVDTFVRTLNDKGETALHCAARIKKSNLHFPEEDRMIIKLLMESGSDVFIQTKEVYTLTSFDSFAFKISTNYFLYANFKSLLDTFFRIEKQFFIMLPMREM